MIRNSWERWTPRTIRWFLAAYSLAVIFAVGIGVYLVLGYSHNVEKSVSGLDAKLQGDPSRKDLKKKSADSIEFPPLPEPESAAWLGKKLRHIPMLEVPVEAVKVEPVAPPPAPPPQFTWQLIATSVESKPELSFAAFRSNGAQLVVRVGGQIEQQGEKFLLKKVEARSVELDCRGTVVKVDM